MSDGPRGFTLVVHRDGALDSHTLRIPGWWVRMGVSLAAIFLVGQLGLLLFYGPIVRAAASVPGLKSDIARLEADNAKVRELADALDRAEGRYAQLREMLGGDIVPDQRFNQSILPIAPAVAARPGTGPSYEAGASPPSHWPLDVDGYITRGQIGTETRDEAHPGIDVAVPIGSVVRAAGGGRVVDGGSDAEYGQFVLLEHPGGYRTMYGHLSRSTVTVGQYVGAGEVIGLSGNSGRSSAPHLHFEIRRQGRSLDPLQFVQEGVR